MRNGFQLRSFVLLTDMRQSKAMQWTTRIFDVCSEHAEVQTHFNALKSVWCSIELVFANLNRLVKLDYPRMNWYVNIVAPRDIRPLWKLSGLSRDFWIKKKCICENFMMREINFLSLSCHRCRVSAMFLSLLLGSIFFSLDERTSTCTMVVCEAGRGNFVSE